MVRAPSIITSEECRCVLRVEFLLKTDSGYFLNIGSASVLGDNYEQNGVIKGRGKVRWNRLGGHKMGGLYCGREAEISRSLRRTRNRSQEIENRGFRKRHNDRDILFFCFYFILFYFISFYFILFFRC